MRTWTTVDKSKWQRGEWDDEPDKAHWVDPATGLDCLIVRGPSGALCGYVGVPEEHPSFGADYDAVDVDVHWGLTFANKCAPDADESKHICHPKEGAANEHVWWLGFDCAHSGDLCPAYSDLRIFHGDDTYRHFNYVKRETEQLAAQLKAMA